MKSSFRTEQTATGFLLGTPGFMSPEQAIGNRPQIDAQTDIWAVGATLFTLISGEPVHAGESAAEMLVAAANYAPRSLATVTNGLNPRLVSVVDRAVAFEKANRWPNARSMQSALREAAGKQTTGQVSRRSIPDATEIEDEAVDVVELDSAELKDAKTGSWGSSSGAERTVVAKAHVPVDALPSHITRPVPPPAAGERAHPADEDGPTLAVASTTTDPSELAPRFHSEPPLTPHMAHYSSAGFASGGGMLDEVGDGGTLIMESPAAAHEDGAYPPASQGPRTAPKPFGQTVPFPVSQPPQSQQRQQFHSSDPRGMSASVPDGQHGGEMMYLAGPAARPQTMEAPPPNRVLVFIAVAVVTMVVVIVSGLVILAVSD